MLVPPPHTHTHTPAPAVGQGQPQSSINSQWQAVDKDGRWGSHTSLWHLPCYTAPSKQSTCHALPVLLYSAMCFQLGTIQGLHLGHLRSTVLSTANYELPELTLNALLPSPFSPLAAHPTLSPPCPLPPNPHSSLSPPTLPSLLPVHSHPTLSPPCPLPPHPPPYPPFLLPDF